MKRPPTPAERTPPRDRAEPAALRQRVEELEAELDRRARAVAARDAQLARLRLELAQRDEELAGRRPTAGVAPAPASGWRRWAAALGGLTRSPRRLVEQSGLLDRAWYLARYPDVARAGMDALDHYLAYGAAEGRDPGPRFDTRFYLATYPDVAARGVNPLVDHLERGTALGRRTLPGADETR